LALDGQWLGTSNTTTRVLAPYNSYTLNVIEHRDFSIGLEFWCGNKPWRCTDVGSRVVVAICLAPRDAVRISPDPNDETQRIQTSYVSDDPRDLSGPPYGVVERVFDENDLGGCQVEREDNPGLLSPAFAAARRRLAAARP
jgi:hypothetical protein